MRIPVALWAVLWLGACANGTGPADDEALPLEGAAGGAAPEPEASTTSEAPTTSADGTDGASSANGDPIDALDDPAEPQSDAETTDGTEPADPDPEQMAASDTDGSEPPDQDAAPEMPAGPPPLFPPPTAPADRHPSPNNPAECPDVAPENPWGPCAGLPVYLTCEYSGYNCICDWIHWICVG